MAATHSLELPYHEIIVDLVESTRRALGEIVECDRSREVTDLQINRHFAWLAIANKKEGENRHLFDGGEVIQPLRTKTLRSSRLSRLSSAEYETLLSRKPLDEPYLTLVQKGPTRISKLIKQAYNSAQHARWRLRHPSFPADNSVVLPSPLAIVYDFLTIPDMPGSKAYVLLSLRSYLFEMLEVGAKELTAGRPALMESINAALSRIWTSFRPRFESQGGDPLPARGRTKIDTVVRHYLAMRGLLLMRFEHSTPRRLYTTSERFTYASGLKLGYEFERHWRLARLPDNGEIINELLGIPLPIRGADTVFRGGLRLNSENGLVLSIQGGPGTGKTSAALALAASLAPFGIPVFYVSADEQPRDLFSRVQSLVPEEARRLSFSPADFRQYFSMYHISDVHTEEDLNALDVVQQDIQLLNVSAMDDPKVEETGGVPTICRSLVIVDGLQDLFASGERDQRGAYFRLSTFINTCRELEALVVLTAGTEWQGYAALDYLVDVAVVLTHESVHTAGSKPDRRFVLIKARNQLCAPGSHGFSITSNKGFRFSPQTNYQLDRRAHMEQSLHDSSKVKTILQRCFFIKDVSNLSGRPAGDYKWSASDFSNVAVPIYRNSSVFLNGRGSSGKAAMAVKLAIAPTFDSRNLGSEMKISERVLIISFLYPKGYYDHILERLVRLRKIEYAIAENDRPPRAYTIHLYPGALKPDDLFNRIDWTLDAARLNGDPFTAVILDGIHNVFQQFPEIESTPVFWPQLYASLRAREMFIVTTHTFLTVPDPEGGTQGVRVDNQKSEPLRQALVQQTDYHLEVNMTRDAVQAGPERLFSVRIMSAIGYPIPLEPILWSRRELVFALDVEPRLRGI